MMTRCNSGETARAIASERRQSFGWSVHGGAWYVGTPDELRRIGCPDCSTPAPASTRVELLAGWGFWEQTGFGERFARAAAPLAGELVRQLTPAAVLVQLDDGRRIRTDARAVAVLS